MLESRTEIKLARRPWTVTPYQWEVQEQNCTDVRRTPVSVRAMFRVPPEALGQEENIVIAGVTTGPPQLADE